MRKRQDRYTQTEIDDEIVVMNLDNGDFFSLTGTARTIWELLDRELDFNGLMAALADSYEGEAGAVAGDVMPFLADLEAAGLLDRP